MSVLARIRNRSAHLGVFAKILLVLLVLSAGNILCWLFYTIYW